MFEDLEARVQQLERHIGNCRGLLAQNECVASLFNKLQRELDNLRLGSLDLAFYKKCKG